MKIFKSTILLSFFSLFVFFAGLKPALAQLTEGGKDTICIGRLQIQPSVREMSEKQGYGIQLKNTAESLETQLVYALSATGVFQVVERKRKADIELEQAFANVAVDPNDKNAAKALKMTGAKYVFLPQIDSFEDIVETQEFQAIGRVSRTRKLFLSAMVQIVDTTTGTLLPDVSSVQLDKTIEIELARPEIATLSERVLVELAKEMANKLAQTAISALRPAKILSVTGKEIFINRGTEAGFNKNDRIEIYATKDVIDTDTGTVFKEEIVVGKAIIVRSDKKQSYATITGDNLGVDKGCIVRVDNTEFLSVEKESKSVEKQLTPGSSEEPLKWSE